MEEAKDTKGKLKWNLINLKELEGLIKVRMFGTVKYKDSKNWTKVGADEYYCALMRHLVEIGNQGLSARDNESGLRHIDHALCNLYFMASIERGEVPLR